MLPLSGNVQAGEDSCMRSKSPAFPKCASGYHPAPPPPADPAGAPKQGGVGLAPLRGTTPDYLFAGAELTRSCCIIYRGSFHQGTALAPSLPCCRGSKPAEHTHTPRSRPSQGGGEDHCGGKGRSSSSLPPRRGGRGTPRLTALPVPAPLLLTLILSTAASSFSCSTSRCMVLRLPPDDIPEPRGKRRG